MEFSSDHLIQYARELGFNLVGIAPAEPSPYLDAYFRWIEAGMHGTMGYMARPDRQARRRDLNVILPGVRSLVVVGLDYRTALPDAVLNDPTRGRIAAYAWGQDYHDVMTPRLDALGHWLRRESRTMTAHRAYVDTGAILERAHAQRAGLGFIGKNTMLIHPRRGSYFFLGELLTDLEFDRYDTPATPKPTLCGRCTRCLTACPTDAFPQPHVLDARRCISYLTIEHKDAIDPGLRARMGNWIFGCDICQEVCPFQRFAPLATESAFTPRDLDRIAPPLESLLALDDATFKARFGGSPIERIGRERLVRNACVAAGNSGDPSLLPRLHRLCEDASPLVCEHARWAVERLEKAKDSRALPDASERRERPDSAETL